MTQTHPAADAAEPNRLSPAAASAPPAAPAAPAAPPTDREMQRAAVSQLISLATECAQRETQIESTQRTALTAADRELSDRRFELDERQKRQIAEANARKQQQQTDATTRAEQQRASHNAANTAERRRLETQKRDVDEELRKRLDHAIWLADSVLELENNGAAADYRAASELAEATTATLNGYEVRGAELVQRYGLAVPTDVPPAPHAADAETAIVANADAAYTQHQQAVQQRLGELDHLPVARLFVGFRPFALGLMLVLLAAGVAVAVQIFGHNVSTVSGIQPGPPAWAAGAALVVAIVLLMVLRRRANAQILAVYIPLRQELALARRAAAQQLANAAARRDTRRAAAVRQRAIEVQAAKDLIAPLSAKATRDRDAGMNTAAAEFSHQLAQVEAAKQAALTDADQRLRRAVHDVEHAFQRDTKNLAAQHQQRRAQAEQQFAQATAELRQHWEQGLARIAAPIQNDGSALPALIDWNDPAWQRWTPAKLFASRVVFGQLHADLRQISPVVPKTLEIPPTFALPALLAFPSQASLLIETDHAGRTDGIRTLQMLMARLLVSLPAGRVRFTMLDPVGLGQNFAGFMHLADYDDQLVGGRIWTSQEQIEQRLADLTDHMETVIQKYLRNEFATIDDYNAQAGELAEPYRFLVIADLPINFSADAFRRLTSIAASGARCGVYTLVLRDTRAPLPPGAHMDELKSHGVHLVRQEGRFIWDDPVFRQLPLTLLPPPPEEVLTQLLHKVGAAAKENKRVEVPFETIAPPADKIWSASSTSEVNVSIGRLGANRLQSLKLGRGVAQHVLIAGKTGSGKSTLLHAMITNAALWYSPDELELYLIDFKKGVEFKTYATHLLPHARAIAVESDREFGLSVLQRLDAELARRGELFRKAGVQDLASYRATPKAQVVPRTLLMIDEFQEFFTEDDKLAQEAALLIDRLVRQGRAFGIHVLLGSQTIGGAGGLPRSTLGQMAVRIALQTTEADSQLILGDNNSAARLLTRPGEAIYNDAGGLVEGNSPFQVAWLPDAKRDVYLDQLASRAEPYFARFGRPVVFEGNAFADIRANAKLAAASASGAIPAVPQAWIGEPVAIKSPTAIGFRRQAGANVLIAGQQDEQALAVMASTLISLAAQQTPERAKFVILDGTAADSALAGTFARIAAHLPHEVKIVEWRRTEQAIADLAAEVKTRSEAETSAPANIYLFVYALQRYRQLRKTEEDFSFSMSDEPKKPNPGKQFAELLREGPAVGVHVITWADTMVTLDRTLDRASMREFDSRVLFQMSASDSSNLIDSPAANKLGFFRALLYSEEQGTVERFRPYALPAEAWLAQRWPNPEPEDDSARRSA